MFYLLICFITFYLSSRLDLFYDNITGVSLLPQYHLLTIVYMFFCATFFAYKTYHIYQSLPIRIYYDKILILIAYLSITIGITCPYTMNQNDLFSILHVSLSSLGCVLFLVLLWIYTRYLSIYDTLTYLRIHWFIDLSIQCLVILTLAFTRVNGYIEILYVCIVCFYLYLIEKKEKKTWNMFWVMLLYMSSRKWCLRSSAG